MRQLLSIILTLLLPTLLLSISQGIGGKAGMGGKAGLGSGFNWSASPVQVATDCNSGTTTCVLTFGGATTVGNTVFIPYAIFSSSPVSVTDNATPSNTYAICGGDFVGHSTHMGIYQAYITNPSTVVTLTLSPAGPISAHGMEFSGGATSSCDAGGNAYGFSSSSSDVSSTTTSLPQAASNELYIAIDSVNGNPVQTLTTAGWTSCGFGSGGYGAVGCAWLVASDSSAHTANWTWTGSTFYQSVPANFRHK